MRGPDDLGFSRLAQKAILRASEAAPKPAKAGVAFVLERQPVNRRRVASYMPSTPLLDTVASPADTRNLSIPQLRQLADELRAETIDAVSVTGGHLGAGLGVVELTVALHHVFET